MLSILGASVLAAMSVLFVVAALSDWQVASQEQSRAIAVAPTDSVIRETSVYAAPSVTAVSLPLTPTPTEKPEAPEATAALQPTMTPVFGRMPCSLTVQPDPEIHAMVTAVSRQNLQRYVQTLESFGTRHTFSTTQSPTHGIGAARNWIYDEFGRVGNGRLQVRFDDFSMSFNALTYHAQNVVATLPGHDTHSGVVVVTAHYDSRTLDVADRYSLAPGANDNASGVAMLLETARLLSMREWNQTIIFVAFAAEEQGTHGSYHFVEESLANGLVVDAAFNFDIVGGRPGIAQRVRVFSGGPDGSIHRQLVRHMAFVGELYLPIFPVDLQDAAEREGRFGDQREFVRANIPALRVTESEEDTAVQHTSSDTSDRLDYNYLFRVTQLSLATLANAIGSFARPEAPEMMATNNLGEYRLTWLPDERAAGYIIFVRPKGSFTFSWLHTVCADRAGDVILSNLDMAATYGVSIAAVDDHGRISLFSPEIMITGL